MIARKRSPRRGLTLLEVLVALLIFGGSVAILGQLITLANDQALMVRMQSRTSIACQAKMAELMVGAESFSAGSDYTGLADADSDLQWKAINSETAPGLFAVTVWVKGDLANGKTVESKLSQMMLDPSVRGSTMDEPIAPNVGTALNAPSSGG